jgi:DNA ligase (NAD+)
MTLSEIYKALNNKDFNTVATEIKRLNNLYRKGDSEISDPDYDKLLKAFQHLDPENEIFKSGLIETADEINPERKEKLKYPMFSLDKEISIEDIHKWLKNKNLPLSTILICTAKYDGISVLKNEKTALAWSRGDGVYGESVHDHYKQLNEKNSYIEFYSIGEMLVPKPIFASRTFYRDNGEPFKNARNMIAGMKNSDKISEDLKFAHHVRYGLADDDFTKNKSEQIDFISKELRPIPYKVFRADELDIDILNDLFVEWGKDYDIDGLVFDIDDKNIRKKLGRGSNNNVAYAKAFKNPEWSVKVKTTILDIEYEISKQGYLKPVAILEPVDLDGVTVSRATLNNARFVKNNNLGIGSEVIIIRSGMVIPKVIEVIKATGFVMPTFGNSKVFWNENEVELMVEGTEEQEIKKLISFFEILGAENVSEGIINQLYNSGYKTIKQILDLTTDDLEKLDRFGERKSSIVYESIHKSVTNVKLSKLMHATNIFKNLGSKKLELLMHFDGKPSHEDIIKIDGFSDISAKSYLDGYDEFYNWFNDMTKITIEVEKEKVMENNDLEGTIWVFTGIRMKNAEINLESRGAKIGSSVSKNTTHLVCKDPNSGSAKLETAKKLGVKIISVEELEDFLNI